MTSVCVVHHLTDGAWWSEGEEEARHAAVVRRGGVCQDVWGVQHGMVEQVSKSVLLVDGCTDRQVQKNFSEVVHKNPTDLHSVSNPQW